MYYSGEMRTYPPPGGPFAMRMEWLDLAFLHWRVPVEAMRGRIPAGLELDVFDGSAWLGVVPFRMSGVAPRGLFAVPGVSEFPELNVRTYVTAGGKPGVWFFSLDADQRVAVEVARRWYHLPYLYARMSCERRDGWIEYRSERRDARGGEGEFVGRYRGVGESREAAAGTLDHFLTERYCLYAADSGGRLYRGEIEHVPWPLRTAEVEIERNGVAGVLAGVRLEGPAEVAHYVERLSVRAWALEAA